MQLEESLYYESLNFAQSPVVPPVVDVLNCLHELLFARFPPRMDVEFIFDRDRFRSQAFNALQQLPARSL